MSDLSEFEEACRDALADRLNLIVREELLTLGGALLTYGGEHGLTIRPDGSFEAAAPPGSAE